MPQGADGRQARQRTLREMVEALGASTPLADERGRLQWARELGDEFPDLDLEGFHTARQAFAEAVRHCSRLEDGLEQLVITTEFLAPAVAGRLRPLLDEWHAIDLYRGRDWSALREGLDLALPELPALVAAATEDRIRLPRHCRSAWHAFVHLACHNAPVGGLEPSMALLEHLMLRTEAAHLVGEIRSWNDHFAGEWGKREGPRGLRALREKLSGRPDPAGRRAVTDAGHGSAAPDDGFAEPHVPVIRLFIKVAPDLRPSDAQAAREGRPEAYYRISSRVRYAESVRLHREDCDPEEPVPRSRLPYAVADLLSATAELWQARDENVVLEFFLPAELLTEPVEWWDRNPRLGHSNPLLSKYPWVYVHSLERMQRRDLHHAWRRRWTRWKSDPGGGRAHWCDPEGRPDTEHLALLDARIGKEEGVVCMVLSDTPRAGDGTGSHELRLGLDLGVPVMIFHRAADDPEAFHGLVKELLAGEGLANLPATARQWRSDAAAGTAEVRDKALIQQLGVVWDDPQQLLDGDACAPAAFVGGTE
ncbi:effector-associated domain 2-containing protein [Streptomyces sp. cg35]|uniref:VMAP-C domain-containing protein n=1 Tax=Streptomyces sp. cg35 TaxID=3421650 RepID=UPI003D166C4A